VRPPILQWKVFLALFGVVLVAVVLGSVLPSNGDTGRTTYFRVPTQATQALTHISPADLRRLMVYRPRPGDNMLFLSPREPGSCVGLRTATIAKTPEPLRPYLERIIHRFCR
jgi:hypothetical protein